MYTGNAAMIRDGGTALGEQECSQILGGLRATKEEQLRGTISQLVLYTKAIIDGRESGVMK